MIDIGADLQRAFDEGYEKGKADRPQDDEFKNFDRESLILLIEAQKERIGELIADRPKGEWIPCSERLPSEKDYIGDVVIWCTDKSIVGVGWYYDSTKSWATVDDTFPPILGEVIAWMPLPKPWKGADDYERAIEQTEHDMLYEPTYNSEDGSM